MFGLVGWRQRLVRNLTGTVLEIGVGTGPNIRHYRNASHVYAIEPDRDSAEEARRVAAKASVPVTIEVAPAESLPYKDRSFDHVVSSLVFCSVHDQHAALNELRRVLKPGGRLHMVEHVRPRSEILFNLFRVLTPWWRGVAGNCHLDRPTLAVLQECGWDAEIHKWIFMFVRLTATPIPEPRFSAARTGSEEEFYRQAYAAQLE